MRRLFWWLSWVLACFPFLVHAETGFGLRFLVDDTLGEPVAMRQRLESWVIALNRYYRNSQVDLHARIVEVAFVPIPAREAVEILEAMSGERDGFVDLFAGARRVGADFSVAVTGGLRMNGKPGCGRAVAVNKTREELASLQKSLMVMHPACGAHTLAHELGHLMGLNHGALVDVCEPGKRHAVASAPYANGFGVGNCDGRLQPGEFGDIMVGGWMGRIAGNDKASLPFFSNPRLHDPRCGEQGICGDPAIGDAARALNENAPFFTGKRLRGEY
ncbi:MAG: hypothetical protein HQL96_16620 [Magnetococcales bacterium]|nr:hypothetical protein [Magnetococcales bacterium]